MPTERVEITTEGAGLRLQLVIEVDLLRCPAAQRPSQDDLEWLTASGRIEALAAREAAGLLMQARRQIAQVLQLVTTECSFAKLPGENPVTPMLNARLGMDGRGCLPPLADWPQSSSGPA